MVKHGDRNIDRQEGKQIDIDGNIEKQVDISTDRQIVKKVHERAYRGLANMYICIHEQT